MSIYYGDIGTRGNHFTLVIIEFEIVSSIEYILNSNTIANTILKSSKV